MSAPRRTASYACAWWVYSRRMPRRSRARARRGSISGGNAAHCAGRAGIVCHAVNCGANRGRVRNAPRICSRFMLRSLLRCLRCGLRTAVRRPQRRHRSKERSMNLEQILGAFRTRPRFAPQFTAWHTIPARPAQWAAFPPEMDPRLARALERRGIRRLYTHQAQAYEAVRRGADIAVVTPTASGKTLCYNLPVLDAILRDGGSRALYLFPTKALGADQVLELQGLIDALGVEIAAFTYDGDTRGDARRTIRAAGHIVVTNPDMLHTAILPHHTKWLRLFENLRYVVLDELHHYRGVFGSHVANVLRRLARICRFYGTRPQFICCSATIGNPREHAERLTGRTITVIDRSGAPSGERVVAL